MRDRDLRQWKDLVRKRADDEWRELSLDVIDELACHLADLHRSAIEQGASEADARRLVLDTLNGASFLEVSKRPRARRFSGGHLHDIRLAFRQLWAAPVVSVVAVLSLAAYQYSALMDAEVMAAERIRKSTEAKALADS